jgi:hypothetical protein
MPRGQKKCQDCEHFVDKPPEGLDPRNSRTQLLGQCHRWPPQVLRSPNPAAGGEPTAVSYWPAVYKNDWCSEFKKRVAH